MPHRRGVGVLVFFVLVLAFLDASAFDGERKGFVLGFGVGSGFMTVGGNVKLDGSQGAQVYPNIRPLPSLDQSLPGQSNVIFATDFKIGVGVSDRLLIYYSVRASWINVKTVNFVVNDTLPPPRELFLEPPCKEFINGETGGLNCIHDESRTVANAVAGIGVSYYLKPAPPSFYITGSVGVSSWTTPFDGDDWLEPIEPHARTWFGLGITGGVGYELTKRWALEAMVMWSNPGKSGGESGRFDLDGDGITDIDLGLDVGRDAFGVLITVNGLAY